MPDIPTQFTLLINGRAETLYLQDVAVWVIVGLSAGFLASRLMLGHGLGPVRELLVGVVGGVLGNLAFPVFGVSIAVAGYPILSQIIVAFFGALFLVLVLRLVGLGRAHRDRERLRPARADRPAPRGRHDDRYDRDRYDDRYDDERYRYEADRYGYERDRYDREASDRDRYGPEPTDWRRTRG
jgi:uncharacterized membrane protein YeaQ/YmgE (transglycosylase-associated protein family)